MERTITIKPMIQIRLKLGLVTPITNTRPTSNLRHIHNLYRRRHSKATTLLPRPQLDGKKRSSYPPKKRRSIRHRHRRRIRIRSMRHHRTRPKMHLAKPTVTTRRPAKLQPAHRTKTGQQTVCRSGLQRTTSAKNGKPPFSTSVFSAPHSLTSVGLAGSEISASCHRRYCRRLRVSALLTA